MNKIPTEKLTEGMIFSKPVYLEDEKNHFTIPAGVELRRKDINYLLSWQVPAVKTNGKLITEKEVKWLQESELFKRKIRDDCYKKYCNYIESIDSLFNRLNCESLIKCEEIGAIASDLINQMLTDQNTALQLIFLKPTSQFRLSVRAVNCAIIASVVGKRLRFSSYRLLQLVSGALVYDIGMLFVPEEIISKKNNLNEQEKQIIRAHTLTGYQLLSKKCGCRHSLALMALEHHERWDGLGYPQELLGDNISVYSRIIAIIDNYLVKINNEVYSEGIEPYSAMRILLSDCGRCFDPKITSAFLGVLGIFPIGSIIELNDGCLAKVVRLNANAPLLPIVEVLVDEWGVKSKNSITIDLAKSKLNFITNIVDTREYLRCLN